MRKVNRILMATIAVLLSLVLITTSVVSGIFAKFVISKEATVSMTLEQFNVKITITPNASLGSTPTLGEIDDNTAVISASPSLAIGDTFYDAFHIQVTGTPNTKVKFIMTCHIETEGNFTVPAEVINYKNVPDTLYMPLGYTIAFKDDVSDHVDLCRPYHSKPSDEIEEIIARNTAKRLGLVNYKTDGSETPYDGNDYYFQTEFEKGKTIETEKTKLTTFYMGFYWPHQYKNGDTVHPKGNVDKVGTWLSENATSITIRYTFRIEQIAEPKT